MVSKKRAGLTQRLDRALAFQVAVRTIMSDQNRWTFLSRRRLGCKKEGRKRAATESAVRCSAVQCVQQYR